MPNKPNKEVPARKCLGIWAALDVIGAMGKVLAIIIITVAVIPLLVVISLAVAALDSEEVSELRR